MSERIDGPWAEAFVLDRHVVSNRPIAYLGEHMQFEATRSPLGELVYQLKYRNGKPDDIIETAVDFVTGSSLGDPDDSHPGDSERQRKGHLMAFLRRCINNLRALSHRARVDEDLDRELAAYLDAAIAAKMAAGLSREAAIRAARAELGSPAALTERVREAGWEATVDRMGRDLRHAWRGLKARGWRGVIAMSLLGVTLAANALVFPATGAFVLHRVPYPNASRLVEMGEQDTFGWLPAILPETVPAWREFTDLFSAFHWYVKMGGRR